MKLDEHTQGLLSQMVDSGAPPLYEMPVEEARAGLKEITLALDAPFTEVARIKQTSIPGKLGDIPLRIYWPQELSEDETLPILMQFHGGGFALGDLDTHENCCRYYCKQANLIVISVDYRLAPEFRFPAGIDDCYAALCWAAENASQLGGDADRIAVTGDSAGGNLSAVVCQMARDRQGPAIAFQALVYPAVSMNPKASFPSRDECGGGEYFLSMKDMEWFNGMYLADPGQHKDVRVSPLLAESLVGLPPALIITAGFDPLRDEGRAYYERLVQAGVEADYYCFETTIHGFFSFSGLIEVGREGLQMVADRLRDALSSDGG